MPVGGGLGSDSHLGEGVQTFGGHSAWRQVRDAGSAALEISGLRHTDQAGSGVTVPSAALLGSSGPSYGTCSQ